MRFGLILLGLIIAVSVAGSLIPQNNEAMYYVRNYPNLYSLIFSLKLNQVFTSWYFLLLAALLCVNLAFCTIRRMRTANFSEPLPDAFKPANTWKNGEAETVKSYLRSIHCKETANGSVLCFERNGIGTYGSLLLHLGILLTTVFWALGSAVPSVMDRTCMPGESFRLEDGTEIRVNSFSIEDETGRLDYSSHIEITLPDGRSSGEQIVSVNHPVTMGDYKVYQQTYGTKGKLSVTDTDGHKDTFYLDSQDFLSADGENGIWFDDLYPGFEQDETGALTMITQTSGHYENPVYVFVLRDHERSEQMLAFPGDSVTIDSYTFTFEEPTEYPGLRIKHAPAVINLFLLLSVILLTVGLYLIFFMRPIKVLVNEEGYSIIGRNEALEMELRHAMNQKKGEDSNA